MGLAFEGNNFSVRVVSREVRSVLQEYEIAVRPAIALGLPITPRGQVLLVSQYRAATGGMTLEFPAGSIRSNEDPEDAVRRELMEEAGFVASGIVRLGSFLTAPHFSDEVVTVFAAEGEIASSPTPTSKEDLQGVIEMSPEGLRGLIEDGRLADSKSLAAYMIASTRGSLFGVRL